MTIIEKMIKESGKTQAEIARILNVPRQRVGEYKRGEKEIPFNKVEDWCKKIGVDLKKII